MAWHAKEPAAESTPSTTPTPPPRSSMRLIDDMVDEVHAIEVQSLGRTLRRWRDQILAWHRAKVSNGPTGLRTT